MHDHKIYITYFTLGFGFSGQFLRATHGQAEPPKIEESSEIIGSAILIGRTPSQSPQQQRRSISIVEINRARRSGTGRRVDVDAEWPTHR